MSVSATYFDGRSATARQGSLSFDGRNLYFNSPDGNIVADLDSAELIAPVGRGAWTVELADGARLQWNDAEFGRSVSAATGSSSLVRRLESSWPWAVVALVTAVVGTWALLTYGVPVAARYVAFSVPPSVDKTISEQSIDLLDSLLFEPSQLGMPQQAQVLRVFENVLDEDPGYANFQLMFRRADDIGANAFAVPGGIVIITDDMVELVDSESELAAVLAHEVGHLAQRHGLRILLQDSASAIIIAGLTGDLSSVTALSAAVPTMLMQAKYSRDFEREADAFAFAYLEQNGFDTGALSKLLQRIDGASDGRTDNVAGWFSSHPASTERVPESR